MREFYPLLVLWFKRFLMTLLAGISFDWAFRHLDPLLDYLRFMEPALYYQRLLQTYLVLYILFKLGSGMLKVSFKIEDMYWYVSASIMVNFVFRKYVRGYVLAALEAGLEKGRQMVDKVGVFTLPDYFMLTVLLAATVGLFWLGSERRKISRHRMSPH